MEMKVMRPYFLSLIPFERSISENNSPRVKIWTATKCLSTSACSCILYMISLYGGLKRFNYVEIVADIIQSLLWGCPLITNLYHYRYGFVVALSRITGRYH